MSERKIKVPEGMLAAALDHMRGLGFNPARESTSEMLEEALIWLTENPIVPSPSEFPHLNAHGKQVAINEIVDWQRRIFLAPDMEIPDVVRTISKRLFPDVVGGDHIVEVISALTDAYRQGQKDGCQ